MKKSILVIVAVAFLLMLYIFHDFAWVFFPPTTPLPPKIAYELSGKNKSLSSDLFEQCNLVGYKSRLVNSCDYTNTVVRNYSVQLAGNSPGELNIGQVCDLFDHYYSNWKYVNDPTNNEYLAKASESIGNNFNGDCDDFAVLLCSSILAIGGEARLNFAYSESKGGHAFAEINIGDSDIRPICNYLSKRYPFSKSIWYKHSDPGNRWLNLDWYANYPGGPYFEYDEGTSFYIAQDFCRDYGKDSRLKINSCN